MLLPILTDPWKKGVSVQTLSKNEKRKRLKKIVCDRNVGQIIENCRSDSELCINASKEVDVDAGEFRIQPRLHHVRFSTWYISYKELHKNNKIKLYEIKRKNRYDQHQYRNTSYKHFYQASIPGQIQNSPLNVWTTPFNKYFPGIVVGISLPSRIEDAKFILRYLAKNIPSLNISYVEYAIDYMVDTPMIARELHATFNRFLKILYVQKEPSQYDNYIKYVNSVRFYCRGRDSDKQNRGKNRWAEENFDRVRCEFMLSGGRKKAKLGLKTIEDLIEDTKFSTVIKDRIQFKQAKYNAKYFPKIWEDAYQNFQSTLKANKKIYGSARIDRDIEDFNMFKSLMIEQESAVRRYENI